MLGVGASDELRERGVDDARDLLRTLTAALRERLGEIGEPRDVCEDERPLEAALALRRRLAQPVDREPRDERPQRVGHSLEPEGKAVAHLRDSLDSRGRPLSG